MTISRIKNLLVIAIAAAFLVFITPAIMITASASDVSAGSSFFTDIDNVTVTAATDGMELTSTGIGESSIKYKNEIYIGNLSFKYIINKSDFSCLTLTFISDNPSTESGLIKDVENVLKLSKTSEGKLEVQLNTLQKATLTQNFTDLTEIKYDGVAKKFTVGTLDFILADAIVNNEAYVKISFSGIEMGKTAGVIIKEINSQSFVNATKGYVNDNKAPVMKLDESKLSGNIQHAPLAIQYDIPVYGIDVISSTVKYDIVIGYSADNTTYAEADDITKTSASFTPEKVGYYKIKSIKISDGNGNSAQANLDGSDANCIGIDLAGDPLIIYAQTWEIGNAGGIIPVMTTFDGGALQSAYISAVSENIICDGTGKYQFKAPLVSVPAAPDGVTDTDPKLVNFQLFYKSLSASSWSYKDGLVFTATSTGTYMFRIQAIDRAGNRSVKSPVMTLTFFDATAPKITVSGFSTEEYINQQLTLPTASVTDTMDSSPDTEIKVYYIKDADGNNVYEKDGEGNIVFEKDEEGNVIKDGQGNDVKKKILVSETNIFTPDKLGWYEVIYSATDSSDNSATLSPMTFKVIEPPAPAPEPFIDLSDTWTIVLLSIAGASALGIIILLFVKPKEEEAK